MIYNGNKINEIVLCDLPNWQKAFAFFTVIVVAIDVTSKSKVANFHHPKVWIKTGNQTIPCGQITMNEMQFFHVTTSLCYIDAHRNQVKQAQLLRVIRVQWWSIAWRWTIISQKGKEVTTFHQLE